MSTNTEKLQIIKEHIGSFPNFPTNNVLFRDIFSVLRQPWVFRLLKDVMIDHLKAMQFDCIVGLDARGFLFGPLLSLEFDKPFVPIRKRGKLPGRTKSVSFTLEYGQDIFEIQEDSIRPGDKVLLIDDLLATGGSLCASCELVRSCGGIIVECLVIMELAELKGREKISEKVHSFIQY